MKAILRSAMMRTGTQALTGLALLVLLAAMGCAEITGPGPVGPTTDGATPLATPDGASQVVFSLNTLDEAQLASVVEVDDGVTGARWCLNAFWINTETEWCNGRRQTRPMGEVTLVDGELRLASGSERGAPFLWTGSPNRENPFPESGDFAVDIRMTYEDLASYGTGAWVLAWDPAAPEGTNSPMTSPVLRVWADGSNGVRATLLWVAVDVPDPLAPHWYRVTYEDGAYSLSIDGEQVAGPIANSRRPNATWFGNPTFITSRRVMDWSDFRLAEFTVSVPAALEIEVGVDVKPDGCDASVKVKDKGVVPAAILGVDGELDVSEIDPATIRLEGVTPLRSSIEDVATPGACDVGGDGVDDLTIKFDNGKLAEALNGAADGEERTLELTGNLREEFGGTAIVGQDVVIVKNR